MTFEQPKENKMAVKKIDDLATKEDLANHFKDLKDNFKDLKYNLKAFKCHILMWQLILYIAFDVYFTVFLYFCLKHVKN